MLVLIPGIIIIIALLVIVVCCRPGSEFAPVMAGLAIIFVVLTAWLSNCYWVTLDISRTDNTISFNTEVYKRHSNYGLIPIADSRIMDKGKEASDFLRRNRSYLSDDEQANLQAIIAKTLEVQRPYSEEFRKKQVIKVTEEFQERWNEK
jgi:hypothetical protein